MDAIILVLRQRWNQHIRQQRSLCQACLGINFKSLSADHMVPGHGLLYGYRWHTSSSAWLKSAKTCGLCVFLSSFFGVNSPPNVTNHSVWLHVPDIVSKTNTHITKMEHRLRVFFIEEDNGQSLRQLSKQDLDLKRGHIFCLHSQRRHSCRINESTSFTDCWSYDRF